MPAYLYPDSTTDQFLTKTGVQTITGAKTFQAGSTSSTPLTIQSAASQTSNLQEFKDSSGGLLGAIGSNGIQSWGPNGLSGTFISAGSGRMHIQTTATGASNPVLTVRGAASQSGNLQQWENSAGTILTYIKNTGGIYSTQPNEANVFGGATSLGAILSTYTGAAGNKGLVIRAVAGQTANLVEFQNSAGTAMASIAAHGYLTGRRGAFVSEAANGVVLQVQGAASQTANLFEAVDSAGTVLSYVTHAGAPVSNVGMVVYPRDSGQEGLVVVGRPSQTTDLAQFRNSAGSVLSSIGPTGYLTIGPNSWNKWLRLAGGGGPDATTAVMHVSNGNVHLDNATGGYGLYFNWYSSNTLGTYWGNGASSQVGRVDGGGAASFVSVTSTSRLDTKKNIERVLEDGPDDDKFLSLNAVRYVSTLDRHGRPLHSFVAEEAVEVMPEIVSKDEDNEIVGINLTSLVTILTTQVQNLTVRVRELESK